MRFRSGSLVLILALGGLSLAGPVSFSVIPVALPPGYTFVNVSPTLNNLGQVAGVVSGPGNATVPFITTGSSSVAVPFPTSVQNYVPTNVFINDSGQIAGTAEAAAPNLVFFGTATGVSFVPSSSGVGILGLNDSGTFVGNTVPGGSGVTGTASGVTPLSFPEASAINNLGQVLVFQFPSMGANQAFILTGGSTALLAVSGSDASSLNDNGQAVGTLGTVGTMQGPFVANTSGAMLIPGVGSPLRIFINDSEEVVGFTPGGVGGFIWDPIDGTRSLSALIPPGWAIDPTGINNLGQIVGFGSFMGGANEAVLLTSTPEPATIFLAATALLAFAIRRRYSPMM